MPLVAATKILFLYDLNLHISSNYNNINDDDDDDNNNSIST